jgi:hypothetical protein
VKPQAKDVIGIVAALSHQHSGERTVRRNSKAMRERLLSLFYVNFTGLIFARAEEGVGGNLIKH